jgi:hypothetical protein
MSGLARSLPTMTVADELRAWARGMYSDEAAVELIIRLGLAHETQPWIGPLSVDGHRWVDAEVLVEASGAWSGGEKRIIRIAASLLGGDPVALHEDVAGLDRYWLSCVLAAVAHAGGSHEQSDMAFDEHGAPAGFDRLPTLFPWPEVRR